MWRLIRAELGYRWQVLVIGTVVAMPLVAGLTGFLDPMWRWVAFFVAWGVTSGIVETRYDERRDMQLAMLPVADHELAVARIATVFVPFVVAWGVYTSMLEWFHPGSHSGSVFQLGTGVMLSLSGIQWMALDLSPAVSRRGYDVHGKIAAGTVFLGIMILGAYVYITRSEPHPLLAAFFRTAFFRSPFEFVRSNVGPHILLLLSLVLVGLSVLTHRHRRCVPRV